MTEETIVYSSIIVRVIKDSPPEDTQNCSPLIRRLTGPVGYHYVIELLIPCYMTTMMHGLYLHIFLFCFYGGTYKFYSLSFFFSSVSFLFCLIVANSEYLCFRCTVFKMILYCSLVCYILGIIYVDSTGRQLLV